MNFDYSNLQEIFGSKLKADEFLYLVNGLKPVIRQLFFEDELERLEKFCLENNLFLVKSSFKVVFLDLGESFSNKGQRVPLEDFRKGAVVIYLSLDEKLANLAALYELQNDHLNLGNLLGYPKCCCEFFLKNFADETPNPEINEFEEKLPDSWMLDISKRDQDLAIISHFPCSWICKKSNEIAKKRLNLLKRINSYRFEELLNLKNLNGD